jgi:hypothetical protein
MVNILNELENGILIVGKISEFVVEYANQKSNELFGIELSKRNSKDFFLKQIFSLANDDS